MSKELYKQTNEPMNRPDQREQRVDGIYFHPETGQPHVSVTTVLDGTLMKYPLLLWYANMATRAMVEHPEWAELGFDEAKKRSQAYVKEIGQQAKDRGSRIHTNINDYFRGRNPRVEERDMGYWTAFEQFVEERKPRPIDIEMTLYSSEHGVAGTGDFFGHLEDGNGLPEVLDFKSGGAWPEHLYQTGAYHGMLLPEIPTLGGTRIIQLKENGKYSDRVRSTTEEAKSDFGLFLKAKDLYVDRNTSKLTKVGYLQETNVDRNPPTMGGDHIYE